MKLIITFILFLFAIQNSFGMLKNDSLSYKANKYKSTVGVYTGMAIGFWIGGGQPTSKSFIYSKIGFAYEHFVFKRYAVNLYFNFGRTSSFDNIFLNSEFKEYFISNKIYLKKLKDIIYLSFGGAFGHAINYNDNFSFSTKQLNLTSGFGCNLNLKSIFKKLKSDHFSLDIFLAKGMKWSTYYPNSIVVDKLKFPNFPISSSAIGLIYRFNS